VITRLLFIIIKNLITHQTFDLNTLILDIAKMVVVAVVLLMVAVPEGLPLCISLAMALSIKNLKDDEILIKSMDAVQTCAMFNDLCVGKTGTLTSAKLKVQKYQLGNAYSVVSEVESCPWTMSDGLTDQIKSTIVEGIISLSDVRLVPND
jgi:Ca2+-transporting ATPase